MTRCRPTTFVCALLVAAVVTPRAAAAQVTLLSAEQVNERHRMVNRLRDAADLYRAGATEQALGIEDGFADARSVAHLLAEMLPKMLAAAGRRPPVADPAIVELQPWTIEQGRAFAALQMETLLRDFFLRNAAGHAAFDEYRAEGADELFAVIAAHARERSAAPRWELALGLTAFSQRHLGWAGAVLGFGCRKHPDDASLQLACGSVAGMKGAQPADLLLQEAPEAARRPSPQERTRPRPMVNPLDVLEQSGEAGLPARLRQQHLKEARRILGDLIKADPSNVETRLRLAHADVLAHDDRAAAAVLEPMVAGAERLDARATFLACLFLAGIRQRAGQPDAAVLLLDQAVVAVPSGQTALVARAALERTRGDDAAARAALDRLLHAPAAPGDPWRDFFRGPYWLIEPMLTALRAEARR